MPISLSHVLPCMPRFFQDEWNPHFHRAKGRNMMTRFWIHIRITIYQLSACPLYDSIRTPSPSMIPMFISRIRKARVNARAIPSIITGMTISHINIRLKNL